KIKEYLDSTIYPSLNDLEHFERLDPKVMYKRKNAIACSGMIGGKRVTFTENFSHFKTPSTREYFEIGAMNMFGIPSGSFLMKSEATIGVFVIWDDATDKPYAIHFLDMKKMQKEAYRQFKENGDIVSLENGGVMNNGEVYTSFSWRFDPDNVPSSFYV